MVKIACSEDYEPPPWRTTLHTAVIRLLREMALARIELSILLCGAMSIRTLNATFRGQDTPTDVLSFPQYSHGYDYRHTTDYVPVGDIAISIPVAVRTGICTALTELEGAIRLTIHGILHLLGFDHTHDGAVENDCMLITADHIYHHHAQSIS